MKLAVAFAILALMLMPAKAGEPFGLNTVPSHSAYRIAIWRDLQVQMAKDQSVIALCRVDPACGSDVALRLIGIVDGALQHQGRERVGHLNRAINLAITATRAIVPWLPPLAALAQPGDCKSYAIAKYFALGEAGITATDRRLVSVRTRTRPGERHLIVVVRDGERWLILDNRTLALVDSTAAHSYEPLYEFDVNGVRDFQSISHGVAEFRPSIKKREVPILELSQQPSFRAPFIYRPYPSRVGEPKRSRCQM